MVPLNKRTKVLRYPANDVRHTKLALGRSNYISQIDLKAGFFNCRLETGSQKYTAFACALGVYVWLRMTMGLQNAPAHFQQVMETVLLAPEAGRPLPATILLDDTTLFEDSLQ